MPHSLSEAEMHLKIEEITLDWEPGDDPRDRPTNIPLNAVEVLLGEIFSTFASQRVVKEGVFPSDLMCEGGYSFEYIQRGEFPVGDGAPLVYDPAYGKNQHGSFSRARAEQLGVEIRDDTLLEAIDPLSQEYEKRKAQRSTRSSGRTVLANIHPIPLGEIDSLPLLRHYCCLWDTTNFFHRPKEEQRVVLRERLHGFVGNGVIGNPNPNAFTYLSREDFIPTYWGGGGCGPHHAFTGDDPEHCKPSMCIVVDPIKLADMRHLYYDPEGSFIKEEFKNTFIIRGGIPFQAVCSIMLNKFYFQRS